MVALTQKQYDFVLSYVKSGSAQAAAIAAGYSPTYARVRSCELLQHPLIKSKLQSIKVGDNQELAIKFSAENRVKTLQRIIDDVMPEDGSKHRRKYYKDAIRAMQEINKMMGSYAPTKALTVTVNATKERLADAKKQYKEY